MIEAVVPLFLSVIPFLYYQSLLTRLFILVLHNIHKTWDNIGILCQCVRDLGYLRIQPFYWDPYSHIYQITLTNLVGNM